MGARLTAASATSEEAAEPGSARSRSRSPAQEPRAASPPGDDGPGEPERRFFFGDVFKEGRYEPLHPELFEPGASSHWDQWLAPAFKDVVAAAKAGDPRSALREESPGVYSFELFSPEFCDKLLEEVEHAQAVARDDLERPNGMNRYGIVLNQLGLEPLITALQQEHLQPLQAALYPEEADGSDDHHCFIVRYRAGEDVGLDMHEDDADVTLNVCLGKEFTAATLSFCGMAADEDHRRLRHTYAHERGRAVIHLGRQRHGADNIESGERVNFILWSTSKAYRASAAYRSQRMRSASAADPDPICLSYTHDGDYVQRLGTPSRDEALARGVMLDVVERRAAVFERPVHDLAAPIEEINSRPSVCLFLEGLPPERQKELFGALMHVAGEVLSRTETPDAAAPPILFFVGVQPAGATPQVRALLAAEGSPALAILDVAGGRRYRLNDDQEVTAESLRRFVEAFQAGELPSEPLASVA